MTPLSFGVQIYIFRLYNTLAIYDFFVREHDYVGLPSLIVNSNKQNLKFANHAFLQMEDMPHKKQTASSVPAMPTSPEESALQGPSPKPGFGLYEMTVHVCA